MAAKKKPKPPPKSEPPRIHEAELASGPSGVVLKGQEIDLAAAVARRRRGQNIVVCGNDVKANGQLAKEIEAAVGPYKPQAPHRRAGPHSLPHFQQQEPPPVGHSFYETANPQRKARKQA
jgi:hypothetical protein